VMALKNMTQVVTNKCYNKDFVSTGNTQKQKLVNGNVLNGGNDTQLKAVLDYYKMDLISILHV
jgi:hypothetical protein